MNLSAHELLRLFIYLKDTSFSKTDPNTWNLILRELRAQPLSFFVEHYANKGNTPSANVMVIARTLSNLHEGLSYSDALKKVQAYVAYGEKK